jgi:aspartate racemase
MRKLGLIGGTSWVSTVDYYRLINEGINAHLGGLNFAECLIYSFNYADIVRNNNANDWDSTFRMISAASQHLINGGATGIVLCANTMHLIADRVQAVIDVPVIHIGEATADAIVKAGVKKVGLLGTKFTMELDFIKSKLRDKGIEVLIPGDEDRTFIHGTIFDELGKGIVTPETKKRYIAISEQLVAQGAEGIILGCTEIPMVIKPGDLTVPTFDTTEIHTAAAVKFALG